MGTFHSNQFPRETEDYRRARDQLLELEIKLRKHLRKWRHCVVSRQVSVVKGEPISDRYYEWLFRKVRVTRAKNPHHHPLREIRLFKNRLFGANGSLTILAMASLPKRELKRNYSKRDAIFDSQHFSKLARRSDDMLTTYVYNRSRIDNFDYHDFTQSDIKSARSSDRTTDTGLLECVSRTG